MSRNDEILDASEPTIDHRPSNKETTTTRIFLFVRVLYCRTVGRAEEECVWCAGWFLLEAAAVLESSLASKKRRIPLEMGGSSKGKKKGGGQDAAPPACTCDHPFQCDCGNRPPRPSRGHKWDSATQQWGGKGHKQKGAALGQAAFVAKEQKVTTAVGNTTLAAHQRLPSQILAEYCQKHKRPRHFYKEIPTKQAGKAFQYRLILPESDAKKDSLRFIPAEAVANAEQAKEEAALLALLHFTPNLPHERKLPEPYRTTWLHALQAQKESKAVAAKGKNKITEKAYPASSDNQDQSSSYTTARPAANGSSSGGARASSGLRSAVAVNRSVKEEERKRQRQVRNARIQKHEAIRLANQPHPVFMSAKLRQAIERILRRERVKDDADDVEEDDAFYLDSVESEIQEYVEERLHREGFTRKQARDAFLEVKVVDHDLDKVYEACLQWLLIHVDEDDLPPSFDPRGRTLDVIVGATPSSKAAPDPKVLEFSKVHGMSVSDAAIIFSEALAPEEVLWQTACRLAGASPHIANLEAVDKSIMVDELEALEAIFAEDCQVNQCENIMIVVLPLDEFLELQINLDTNAYPEAWPQRILVRSKTSSSWSQGLSLLTETAKFLVNDIVLGEPMIFVIHGHVNELVQTLDELKSISLTPSKEPPSENARSTRPSQVKPTESATTTRPAVPPPRKRPRERSPFWSLSPTATPPAVAYPASNLKRIRASLPAAGARADFIKALKQADKGSHVVLCTGETGCGKSTQLPQFILEEFPKEAKIVVCQPRRLAATGVANRIAEERGESQPGVESVGYVVRGDTAMCRKSRLVFCTTGVLLRQLQNESALTCLTHIVIDEVHERNLDTDILLALLKQSLPAYPHLRVVLMSATLDADRFAGYWKGHTPRIHIPGRTFPVKDYMLEDVLTLTKYIPPKPKKGRSTASSFSNEWDDEAETEEGERINEEETIQGHQVADLVKRVDESSINYDLLAQLVRHLVLEKNPADDGSILVFLPGAPEIDRALEAVKKVTRDAPVLLLPLHGGLHPKDQNRVFKPAGIGLHKIVLSTNVAETSVTIPDCTIVIDTAREKQSSYDPSNRMPMLVEQFCSKASLKQRRGRAGRVREGTSYKLISKATYSRLREHGEPEIRRSALDQTLLSILFLGMECRPDRGFMQTLLDPPDKTSIEAAAFSLQSLGAVETNVSGSYALTPLGVHLAGIPAPPIVGKILILGSILGCRNAAIAMAAGMSVGRSPFLRIDTWRKPRRNGGADEPDSIEEAKQKRVLEERKALFQTVGNSDHALSAAVHLKWESLDRGLGRKRYCESMGLSFQGMRDVNQLTNQLDSALRNIGYHSSADSNRNGQSWRIVRAVAVAGMAPSQLVKVVRPAAAYLETAEGAKEKDGEARGLKFFVRTDNMEKNDDPKTKEERVFVHPSSANFSTGSYSCPWLVFNSLVRTSKPFLRDVTECNSYALLLFGGPIEVQASKDIVVVDGWCQLGAHARIGSLMGGLRRRLDELLTQKIQDPTFDIAASTEMSTIVRLIMTDGLGS